MREEKSNTQQFSRTDIDVQTYGRADYVAFVHDEGVSFLGALDGKKLFDYQY